MFTKIYILICDEDFKQVTERVPKNMSGSRYNGFIQVIPVTDHMWYIYTIGVVRLFRLAVITYVNLLRHKRGIVN